MPYQFPEIESEYDEPPDDEAPEPVAAPATVITGSMPDIRRGERIDRALAGMIDGVSRSRLQSLIADGALAIDGATIRDPAYRVKQGGEWRLAIPEPQPAAPRAQALPLTILHEDEHLVVVDKPAGLVVHPSAGHPDGTLVNALLHHCRDRLSGIGGVARPGIVHRLDRDTSGLMVVAKTDKAHAALVEQFSDRSLSRTYWAVVRGVPQPRSGRIDAPIGRDPRDRKKMAVVKPPSGRSAVTNYHVLQQRKDGGCALVECRLETGRTHQIRVHMAHLGFPLLGDPVYARGGARRLRDLPPALRPLAIAFPRQALHAVALRFRHPATGENVAFQAPPPADLTTLITALGMTVPTPETYGESPA